MSLLKFYLKGIVGLNPQSWVHINHWRPSVDRVELSFQAPSWRETYGNLGSVAEYTSCWIMRGAAVHVGVWL